MKAYELMQRDVECCAPEDTLEQAARRMWEHDLGCLPVLDAERRPIGMITDRDICMAAYTQGVLLAASRVSSAMSERVWSCRPEDPIAEVEALMQQQQVRRLPVVDAEGRLLGIVTLADLAHAAQGSRLKKALALPGIARTVAGITERRSGALVGAAQ